MLHITIHLDTSCSMIRYCAHSHTHLLTCSFQFLSHVLNLHHIPVPGPSIHLTVSCPCLFISSVFSTHRILQTWSQSQYAHCRHSPLANFPTLLTSPNLHTPHSSLDSLSVASHDLRTTHALPCHLPSTLAFNTTQDENGALHSHRDL